MLQWCDNVAVTMYWHLHAKAYSIQMTDQPQSFENNIGQDCNADLGLAINKLAPAMTHGSSG